MSAVMKDPTMYEHIDPETVGGYRHVLISDLSGQSNIKYKARELDQKQGTNAKVRVLIETSGGKETWSTVGVSASIIKASWQALRDSLNYKLLKSAANAPVKDTAP